MQSSDSEIWLPVVGYDGLYEVSNLGRVRSLDHYAPHNTAASGVQFVRGRVLKTTIYGSPPRVTVTLWRDREQRTRLVHHLVLEAFVGPRPVGTEGCHWDGDATNNRLGNLRWDSHIKNEADKARHGTHANRAKTHCPQGHLLEAPNIPPAEAARGVRKCRACGYEHSRAFKRGEPFSQDRADAYFERIVQGKVGEKRETCPHGHRLEVPNLMPSSLKAGRRACLACHRTRSLKKPFDPAVADVKYAQIMG